MDADPVEIRVLGCLIEKQRTTPDVYPLSLNALRLACNQATNRDPVVEYDEPTIRAALDGLARRGWSRLASGPGSRAAKFRHLFDEALGLANFRSARRLVLRPGPICAFIGEPGAGKSNVLLAVRALLDPSFDLSASDVTVGERGLSIEATLADGSTTSLAHRNGGPPIAHFPAALRGGDLLPPTTGSPHAVHALVRGALARAP